MTGVTDADQVAWLVSTYADRVHDAVRRCGCSADDSVVVLHRAVNGLLDAPDDQLAGWLLRAEVLAPTDDGLPADDDVAAPVRWALALLPAAQQRVLTIRDGYDLPEGSAAVVLDSDVPTLRRRLGAARVALVSAYDGRPRSPHRPHPDCPADTGDLAALADGTLTAGALGLRRHVFACDGCEEWLEAQARARRMVAGLPLLRLSAPARSALADAAAASAEERLGALAALFRPGAAYDPPPPVSPLLVSIVVALALIVGMTAGMLIRAGG